MESEWKLDFSINWITQWPLCLPFRKGQDIYFNFPYRRLIFEKSYYPVSHINCHLPKFAWILSDWIHQNLVLMVVVLFAYGDFRFSLPPKINKSKSKEADILGLGRNIKRLLKWYSKGEEEGDYDEIIHQILLRRGRGTGILRVECGRRVNFWWDNWTDTLDKGER